MNLKSQKTARRPRRRLLKVSLLLIVAGAVAAYIATSRDDGNYVKT